MFNSDLSSSSKALKPVFNFTVEQLCLDLEVRSSKWLTKDDLLVTTVTTVEWIRRGGERSVDKSIETELKHMDRIYDDILSLTKCILNVRNKKKKKEES